MIINKIFFKSLDLNIYLPRLNSLYLISNNSTCNSNWYIYSNADLKLMTFYYIINIILVVSLFTCYYNAIYKLPQIVKYNKQQINYLLFFIWYTVSIFVKFFYHLTKIYNNIFFVKKYFFKTKLNKHYTKISKIYFNCVSCFFNQTVTLNFFKFNNNFFIFNMIFYKNSIYYNKKNTNF